MQPNTPQIKQPPESEIPFSPVPGASSPLYRSATAATSPSSPASAAAGPVRAPALALVWVAGGGAVPDVGSGATDVSKPPVGAG